MKNPYQLTTPCSNCPFRTDVEPYLRAGRVSDLEHSLVELDHSFPCHKTTVSDGEGGLKEGPKSKPCAGALILLEKLESPSQLMRISERLGMYDRTKLDMSAPVFDTFTDMRRAQEDYEEPEPCTVVNPGCTAPAGYQGWGGIIDGTESAEYVCVVCGGGVCGSCSIERGGEHYCDYCEEDL